MPAKVKITGEIAYLLLIGTLDFSAQGQLSDAIDRALSSGGVKEIRVDMTDTIFIDSSIIRALLNLQETAAANGKSLSIWNCNERIREIFMIGGFDRMLVIH